MRTTSATVGALGIAIAIALAPRVGRAQPTATPAPVEGSTADDRAAEAAHAAEEGKALFAAGLYDGAIERYEASFAIVPSADIQFAIAEAYRAKGDNENAVRAYNLYKSLEAQKPGASAGMDGKPATEAAAPAIDENANPEFIDPSRLPTPTRPPRPVLPRSVVQRPLMLPDGVNEGTIETGVGQQTFRQSTGGGGSWSYVAAIAAGRIGLNAGELFADIAVVAVHSNPANATIEVPIFQHMDAGMNVRIDNDTGVGARISGAMMDSEYSAYAPSVFFAHKWRPSEAGAIVVAGSASYVIQNLGITQDVRGLGAGGSGGFEIQVQPAVAFEAFGAISETWFLESYFGRRSQLRYSYGADVVVAASDHFDIVPFFVAAPVGDTDTYAGGLQLTWH